MKELVLIILFAAAVSFSSCSEDVVGPTPPGAYSYTSYDSLGTAIVKGWFRMDQQDSTQLIGNWSFEKIGNPQDIGPQDGGGRLVGSQKPDTIWIGLNPDVRDSNIHLRGTIKNNKYSGEWMWLSYAGISNHGTFEAVKN